MNSLYPNSPRTIPSTFSNITKSYKNKVWIAFGSLCIFIVLYLLLFSWFSYQSYYLISSAVNSSGDSLVAYVLGTCSTFISLFLLKGLFFVKRGNYDQRFEVKESEQVELFKFIYKLADEAGAPRPYKVFLSADVNACVFYNLSLLDLIFPTKKNLEIGLGLVNVLTLGELKAVLAHEFGHFSQRSMMLGTWVYVAQQVASHFIHQRDMFDELLRKLCSFDLRIAWLGWILNLIVWSLRSVIEVAFRLVVLAQRSLSREMEMHADKVAVSLTGSDELVHALYKLNSGDICWDSALNFAHDEALEDRLTSDIFEIQSALLKKFREIYTDATFDDPPTLPIGGQKSHRVFKTELFQPPKMWATHPSNVEREKNAKEEYVYVELDPRSSWDLFANQNELKVDMTKYLMGLFLPGTKARLVDNEESLKNLSEKYNKEVYKQKYKGTYIARNTMLVFENPLDVYEIEGSEKNIEYSIEDLYPDFQLEKLKKWRSLCIEKNTLKGLVQGTLTSADGVIRHRNKIVSKASLPKIIKAVEKEVSAVLEELTKHDQLCRSVHKNIAASFSEEWESYIVSLAKLYHYAEHSQADLYDAFQHLDNEYKVVIAAGQVSDKNRARLIKATEELRVAIFGVYNNAEEVILPEDVKVALKIESWKELFNVELGLPPATDETIQQWLEVVDGWYYSCLEPLGALRDETLEVLLKTESLLKESFISKVAMPLAPQPAQTPKRYSILTPKNERFIQSKLNLWDRFIIAEGFLASTARTIVAASILGGMVFLSQCMDVTSVYLYNGLETRVNVKLASKSVNLMPHSSTRVTIKNNKLLKITSRNFEKQVIESFVVDASNSFSTYIYNIAGASPMLQWTAVYGDDTKKEEDIYLGASRWFTTSAHVFFKDPPKSLESNSLSRHQIRRVLASQSQLSPKQQLDLVLKDQSVQDFVVSHAKWDEDTSKNILYWMDLLAATDQFNNVIKFRLKRSPKSLINLRSQQTYASQTERLEVCKDQEKLYENEPKNLDYLYLKTRCISDKKLRYQKFKEASIQYPKHAMLAYEASYAYMEENNWEKQIEHLERAYDKIVPLREVISVKLVRLYKMLAVLHPDNKLKFQIKIDEYTRSSNQLSFLERVTQEDTKDYKHYQLLKQGKIEEAINFSMTLGQGPAFLRQAAASDGTKVIDVQTALMLKPDLGVTPRNLWFTIGFHIKHHQSYDYHMSRLLKEVDDEDHKLEHFIKGLENDFIDLELDKNLRYLDLDHRGYAYSMATIAWGDKTPKLWREKAKALLFDTERPYFR